MATLDKFIQVMLQQGASGMRLVSGAAVVLEVEGAQRAVTREALTTPKIMALVREIAPDGMKDHLDAESRMAFGYAVDGSRVDVEILHMGDEVQVTIGPAKPRRSSAAISMPMEARAPAAEASAPAPPRRPAPSAAAVEASGAAEERIQGYLRTLVESGSSDLHLRVGEPPIIRKEGEMQRLEGRGAARRRGDGGAARSPSCPSATRRSSPTTNDTDFAYEIPDLARFRVQRASATARGRRAVFRVIPTKILTAEQLGLSRGGPEALLPHQGPRARHRPDRARASRRRSRR